MKYRILKFSKWLKNYIKEYFKETSFHGLRYIGDDNANLTQSVIWSVVCILGFVIAGIMSHSAIERMRNLPTMTSMESIFHPLGDIPFPGVTICNNNKLYLPGAYSLLESFKSYNLNDTEFLSFLEELDSLINHKPVKDLKNVAKYTEIMQKLGYDSEKLMLEISQPCTNLLKSCKWLGREYNCSLAFQMIKTPYGICCSFNWHGSDVDTEEKTKPTKENPFTDVIFVRTAGNSRAGLSVILDLEESEFEHMKGDVFAAEVLIHDGTDYPEFSVQEAFTEPNHYTTIRIEGSVIESSDRVRLLSPATRKCYYDDEVKLLSTSDYSFQTCMTENMIRKITDFCKCIPFYYPKIIDIRVCNLLDVQCLHEVQFEDPIESHSVMLDCLPQCTDKFYDLSVVSTEIESQHFSQQKGDKYSTLNVFFREVFCVKYRKDSMMTWDGVLSTLGGIFGLCLGGSILSLIEMIYFFTYHVWLHLRKRKPSKARQNALSTKLFKNSGKPEVPQLVVSKPPIPELFQLDYKNILKRTTVSPVGSHMCFETYIP